jgi:hypothetical protein
MSSCYRLAPIKINPGTMNKVITISNLISLILVLVGGIIILRGEQKG